MNRYWAHFFGRGIVEPPDDMRLTNPPSNPELLDGLADQFVKSGYDLRALIRTICTSRVYGLSSSPNETNAQDKQSFARHYPRRIAAEVLLDAIAQVTGVPTPFDGLPPGTRAIDLPDESIGSSFLDAFGRPKRETSCECERVTDASLTQSLMLLNSSDVQTKLSSQGSRAQRLASDPRPDAQKIDELFWTAFARGATARETQAPSPTCKATPTGDRPPTKTSSGPSSTPRSFSLSIESGATPMLEFAHTSSMASGFSRRGFLKVGCLGATGLTLGSLFRAQRRAPPAPEKHRASDP